MEKDYPPVDVEHNWKYVTIVEKRLLEAASSHAPTFDEIESLITQMRLACENVIFFNFAYAIRVNCEKHLWDCHVAINNRYRKLVEAYKKGDQKKLTVERRKLVKRYADFIKTSQFFYKGFIQRLASQYKTNFGLRRIANRLSLEMLNVDEQIATGPVMEQKLEQSCYTTLLRLGDLSRYRNNLRTKDRSWAAATAYYRLAHDLRPTLGSAHNQLAVVAILEGDNLDAVYNIYRAFTAIEPLKDKETNLEVQFHKIITSFDKNKHSPQQKSDSMTTLVGWFTLLHARFYQGVDFPSQKELENEVLTRMTSLLKDPNQNFGSNLEKFVLVNISAEYLAATKIGGDSANKNESKSFKTFVFALTFNIRFMHALLEVLLPELEDSAKGEDIPNSSSTQSQEKISVTCRRVLPALRQYSIWILTRYTHLFNYAVGVKDNFRPYLISMWTSHAAVLTKLLDFFGKSDLKCSTYLLEEDESTLGFKPFNSPSIPVECRMHTTADGVPKPHVTDPGVKRNTSNVEMESRVFDMLIIGYKLQQNELYPLHFDETDGSFVSDMSILTNAALPSPRFSADSSSLTSPLPVPERTPEQIQLAPAQLAVQPAPVKTSTGFGEYQDSDWESEMTSMVQSLVDSKVNERSREGVTPNNDTSYGMHNETAQDVFGQLGSHYTPGHIQTTPKHLPSLPGFNGAFAPKPHEIPHFGPTHTSSYATAEQRAGAARELERITGYANHHTYQPPSGPLAPARPQPFSDCSPSPSKRAFQSSFPSSSPIQTRAADPSWLRNNNNNSTVYPGATDLESFYSSPWTNGRPGFGTAYTQTPPGAQ